MPGRVIKSRGGVTIGNSKRDYSEREDVRPERLMRRNISSSRGPRKFYKYCLTIFCGHITNGIRDASGMVGKRREANDTSFNLQ